MTRSRVVLPEPFGPSDMDAIARGGLETDAREDLAVAAPDLDVSRRNS